MKKWYYISDTSHADPVFLHYHARQVRGLGTVTEAETVVDVLHQNDVYAKHRGRLTAADVYEVSGKALETVLGAIGGGTA